MTFKKKKIARKGRRDASESIYLANQLVQVLAGNYDRRYPEYRGRSLVPTAQGLDPDVETIVVPSFSAYGIAQFITGYSDDIPSANVKAEETTFKVKPIAVSFWYSRYEVRKARRANVDLPAKKAEAARRAVEAKIDQVIATGDGAIGFAGLINQPNASLYTVEPGASTETEWEDKEGDEMLADMIGIIESVITTTNEVEVPNTLLLPRAQYILALTTPVNADAGDTKVIEAFRELYPNVDVQAWNKLAGAGAGGSDRMMAYVRDPSHLEALIPQDFEQYEPQPRNLKYVVPCDARVGGVALYYPLSMAYADGV